MLNLNEAWIIDDDEVFIYVFENVLKSGKHFKNIRSFTHGRAAISALMEMEAEGKELPDIIFCDLRMPFYNLMDFINDSKEINILERSKIVGITVSSHPDDLDFFETNNIPYLIKPVTPEHITNLISRLYVM